VDLPGAEMGKVVVRFPPEASGYLHIGHAKAALLNQYYKDTFQGRLIMRFDDTNPAKETEEFERVILEDVALLGLTYDHFSHTSNHFDYLLQMCEKMMAEGKAYADDTDVETMRKEREQRVESKCRNTSITENLRIWEEMKAGSQAGQAYCIRAKIDMKSDNGCLRDPTIYRCKLETHLSTGDRYKVYPTYDFACPIVDSLEGVTHALRTTEYHDRDPQYYWFCEALGIRKPCIYDYSRLALQNTVLSKRKLTWIVQQGFVDGWDDPRFPTVRGIRRRGLTVEGLKQFIIAQGSSKNVATMGWDKIWAFNKKVIDPVAPLYTALNQNAPQQAVVEVIGQNSVEKRSVAAHPRNADVGQKDVWYSPYIVMEPEDAKLLQVGTNATFINWGNLKVEEVNLTEGLGPRKDGRPGVVHVRVSLNLEDKDFKKTQKVTWLADCGHVDENSSFSPVLSVHYDNLITKPVLGKDEDFKDFINPNSKKEEFLLGDPALKTLKQGDIIQLQRRGYFICDRPYHALDPNTCQPSPCVLFNIPTPESNTTTKPAAPTPAPAVEKSQTELEAEEKRRLKKEAQKSARQAKKAEYKKSKDDETTKPSADISTEMAQNGDAATNEVKALSISDKKAKKAPKEKTPKEKPQKEKPTTDGDQAAGKAHKQTRLGIEVRKEDDFSEWYSQVITKADFMSYYDISGCYYILPNAYFVWKKIYAFFDAAIEASGVEDMYAPMFVSRASLEREKSHIADFAPEVAWVTKAGSTELAEHIAIRPTSETVLYPYYAKRIQSHRDLPLRLNQWCNVVRWEFKNPQPFLRTREFLWQEGHSAFATKEEAVEEVYEILEYYRRVYEELLAIPVIPGRKSEREKFPGAEFTTTVEAYVPLSGRGIQGATSHYLGQNFSRMFDIVIENASDPSGKSFVHQNSWGISTRTIGVVAMVHGDNQGIILPPRVSRFQAVIIPCGITAKLNEEDKNNLLKKCQQLAKELRSYTCNGPHASPLRVHVDVRDNYSPGWKFNHWEMYGVPIRIEIGPKDMAQKQVTVVRRDNGEKQSYSEENLGATIYDVLNRVQEDLYQKAKTVRDANLVILDTRDFERFCHELDNKKIIMAPFCGNPDCEASIKDLSARNAVVEEGAPAMGAKTLCIPEKQPKELAADAQCIHPTCQGKPLHFALFGRSY
jgi:bifunctional glutamyl/prolyl-tRNA synthetase